jgi:tetratricopeptide (TPR) repeat protein
VGSGTVLRRGVVGALAAVWTAAGTACRIQPIHDSEVVANAAVVSVIARTGRHGGAGTGFAISPTRIVTARHVIEEHSDLYVRLADGRQVAAKFVVAESEEHDLAVLEIEPTSGVPVLAWSTESPHEGGVYTCVSSLGTHAQTVTRVVCRGPQETSERFGPVIPWSGDLGPGASGAPILDAGGSVVAVFVGGEPPEWWGVPGRFASALKGDTRWSQVDWDAKTRAEPAAAARDVHDRAGLLFLDLRYAEALRELERGFPALADGPRYAAEGLAWIVACLKNLNREAEIEPRLRRAATEYPDRAWSRRLLVEWLAHAGREEEALKEARALLRCDPDDPDAHSWIASFLLNLRRPAEAEAEARIAVARRPESSYAHMILGTALGRLGRDEAAESELAEAVRLDPSASTARWLHGWALANLSRWEEARAEGAELIRGDPKDVKAHVLMAGIARELGDEKACARELEAIRALDPARAKAVEEGLKKERSAPGP